MEIFGNGNQPKLPYLKKFFGASHPNERNVRRPAQIIKEQMLVNLFNLIL